MKCKTCEDKKVFDYYGNPVACADCSDDLTSEEIEKMLIEKILELNKQAQE